MEILSKQTGPALASSLTYELVGLPQYGTVTVNPDGTFQYTSWESPGVASDRIVINGQYAGLTGQYGQNSVPHGEGFNYYDMLYYPGAYGSYGILFPTTDVFQVKITDPHGASTLQSIEVAHYGPYFPPSPPSGGGGKPIAVDLDGNGFEFVNVDDSNVFFDVNGDGWKRRTAWVGPNDGLLAYDIDGDGKIDKPGEISFARYADGAQTDLEGLRAFDSNGDGRFDAADEKWAKFGVWQDANQNGVTDASEFRTLDEMGIVAVDLTSDGQFQVVNGQTVHGIGSMIRADGSEIAIADVTLAYSNETQVPQGDGTMQTVNASPFSPSGEEIDGTEDSDLILGKNGNNIVMGFGGDDVIFEDGGNDIIDAGDGNDLVYAGADNDLVFGSAGDDVIYAGLGDDVIFGGDGDDAIFAEGGNDIVFGGAGNDLISGGWGSDVLSGDDGDDQIFGESGYDALFGGNGDDELFGMGDADYLNGGAGNDLLDGGAGADEMIGGAGDDTYVVDNPGDTVTELPDEGNDTVRASIDYTLGANVENLILTGTDGLNGTGNELDNRLTGNSGDNTLIGGAGNDRLDGGLGADTLIGGMGDDTYIVDNPGDSVIELAGEGIDTVKSSVSWSLSDNVENLMLTGTGAINGAGNALDNLLIGNAGDNVLNGGAGADTLDGGLGNDTLTGGLGNDTYRFGKGDGQDTITADSDANKKNVLEFKAGVDPEDLTVRRVGEALVLTLVGGDDRITINSFFSDVDNPIQEVHFADGTAWDVAALAAKAQAGGPELITTMIDWTNVKTTDQGFKVEAFTNLRLDVGQTNAAEGKFVFDRSGLTASGIGVENFVQGFGSDAYSSVYQNSSAPGTDEISQSGTSQTPENWRSELVRVTFDQPVTSATVQFAWLAIAERAQYVAYDVNGNVAASGVAAGISDASDVFCEIQITGNSAISFIEFFAPGPYGGGGNSDDFLIHSIQFTPQNTESGTLPAMMPMMVPTGAGDGMLTYAAPQANDSPPDALVFDAASGALPADLAGIAQVSAMASDGQAGSAPDALKINAGKGKGTSGQNGVGNGPDVPPERAANRNDGTAASPGGKGQKAGGGDDPLADFLAGFGSDGQHANAIAIPSLERSKLASWAEEAPDMTSETPDFARCWAELAKALNQLDAERQAAPAWSNVNQGANLSALAGFLQGGQAAGGGVDAVSLAASGTRLKGFSGLQEGVGKL